ncbi:MAG: GNAT family N-acetyltransferase, partial [bacterium]|nr:GNAT family N-acetyltransferase [bacterium]
MSDKRNDFIVDSDLVLYGEKIIVSLLNQSNIESYLSTYKRASAFAEIYENMPDFWETRRKQIEGYDAGEKGSKERYLIAEKTSLQGCGYIELNCESPKRPEVDIAIFEEYRGKGYAFEAAQILIENVLKRESVECIIWNAFASNKASRRIAEKLGGVLVDGKNVIVEAMRSAGFKMDEIDDSKISKMVT